MSAYALIGGGWLRRSVVVQNSSEQNVLNLSLTSPGSETNNSGVLDGGIGVNFRIARTSGLMFFVEGRSYKGLATNHNLLLVPITAGVRW